MFLINDQVREGFKRFPHLAGNFGDRSMALLASLMGFKPPAKASRVHMNFGSVPANPSASDLSPGDLACRRYVLAKQRLAAVKPSDREETLRAQAAVVESLTGLRSVVKATKRYRFKGIVYDAYIDRSGTLHCCERPPGYARRMAPALV